jgi:molybdopterin-guanine dinucleotide biosynthesis protein A
MKREPLTGVVLAGGKSRRLGQDKARVRLDGCELLDRACGLLKELGLDVLVVGRDAGEHGLDVAWVLDDIPGIGPAGGIVTALAATGSDCLVLACDLPFLEPWLLARLMDAHQGREPDKLVTLFRQARTGFLESLAAVYSQEALPLFRAGIARGLYKLSALTPAQSRLHLEYGPEEEAMFFNLNEPRQLAGMGHRPLPRTGVREAGA